MKKELAILFFGILLISNFGDVYAIGRGGGGGDDNTNTGERVDAASAARINCEDAAALPTMRDRIHCRIQNRATYIAPANSVPEACRDLRTATLTPETAQGRCVAYYRVIAPCYDSPEKRACLMHAAGIANSRLSDEVENRGQKARDYVIAILYNLEERLENMNEAGAITDDVTAEGVAKIVEIKRMILEGKSRAEIQPKIMELRVWWHENVSPLRVVENNDNNDADSENSDTDEDDNDDGEDAE